MIRRASAENRRLHRQSEPPDAIGGLLAGSGMLPHRSTASRGKCPSDKTAIAEPTGRLASSPWQTSVRHSETVLPLRPTLGCRLERQTTLPHRTLLSTPRLARAGVSYDSREPAPWQSVGLVAQKSGDNSKVKAGRNVKAHRFFRRRRTCRSVHQDC